MTLTDDERRKFAEWLEHEKTKTKTAMKILESSDYVPKEALKIIEPTYMIAIATYSSIRDKLLIGEKEEVKG